MRWLSQQPTGEMAVTATAVSPQAPSPTTVALATTATSQPIATALVGPATATPYASPSYSEDEIIHLLGPPADSTFGNDAIISFYWQWPLPLSDDQFFELSLLTEGEKHVLGTVNEVNIGDSYRLHVDMGEVAETAVPQQWQVALKTSFAAQPLRTSEVRLLTLFPSTSTP